MSTEASWSVFSQEVENSSIVLPHYTGANDKRKSFEPPLVVGYEGPSKDFTRAIFTQGTKGASFSQAELRTIGTGDIARGVDRVIGAFATTGEFPVIQAEPLA